MTPEAVALAPLLLFQSGSREPLSSCSATATLSKAQSVAIRAYEGKALDEGRLDALLNW